MTLMLKTAALVAVAVSLGWASPGLAQEKQKISIATSSSSIPAGAARIAKEMGLFDKVGIDATTTPMDNGSVATAALLSGSVQFVTTGPTDVVLAQSRGQKLVALVSGYRGFAATVLISKAAAEKTGVSEASPVPARFKALDNLTIASPSATSTFTIPVKTASEAVGAKVKFVYMAQPAMVAALRIGQIDGFIVSAPYYALPVEQGLGVALIKGPRGDFPPASAPANSVVLATKLDFAQANRALISKVNGVFAEFWKACSERPDEVKAAMRRLWPELDAKTIDAVFATEVGGFIAKPATVEDMAREIAFLKLGTTNLPNPEQLDAKQMVFVP